MGPPALRITGIVAVTVAPVTGVTATVVAGLAASSRPHRNRTSTRSGTGDHWPASFTDSICQRLKVIGRGSRRILVDVQPDNLPAKRRGQPSRVAHAEVVAVRLGVGSQWSEHRSRLGVDVGEGGNGGLAARGTRTATKRTHDREG